MFTFTINDHEKQSPLAFSSEIIDQQRENS